jgi:glycosyltransferase involved in cell wall biosynthesis
MPHEVVSTKGRAMLRIGVWCDYGFTLTPQCGIGVFVYHLVAGLLSLEEPIEIVMLVRPGDQAMASALANGAADRLMIAPSMSAKLRGFCLVRGALAAGKAIAARIQQLVGRGVFSLAQSVRRLFARARQGNWPARLTIALGITCTPGGFLILWVFYAAYRLAAAGFRGIFYPIRILTRSAARMGKENIYDPVAVAHASACDVWLIPFAGFLHRLDFPAVLVIHDLIHVHFPDTLDPEERQITDRAFRDRAGEATLCACMSDFIRDHDLRGVLDLPSEKIRVIRPAPPLDLSNPVSGLSARVPSELARPYVFYPSTFRPHKNHLALIEAFHCLNTQFGEKEIDLVFTGINSTPDNLRRLIQVYGLSSRVHVLGCVERSRLGTLYQGALATIVPSLYEQGSFPVYEALHWKCPVACSDIPSLREQCRAMGDAMLYFDPCDAEAIARLILQIRQNRDTFAERQYAAGRALWQRTWTEVAREWLMVLREAADQSRRPASSLGTEKAAA